MTHKHKSLVALGHMVGAMHQAPRRVIWRYRPRQHDHHGQSTDYEVVFLAIAESVITI
jgi:hypothetical protein